MAMSKITMSPRGRARSSSTSSSLIAGWLIAVRRARAPESEKTTRASAARSIEPPAERTSGPNSAMTPASARPPGVRTLLPSSSMSITRAPRSASRRATVLFPAPIPPVRPTISTAASAVRGHEVGDEAGQNHRALALDRVSRAVDGLGPHGRLQRLHRRLVIVVHEDRAGAPDEHDRHGDRAEVLPEGRRVSGGTALSAETVVAPPPRTVLVAPRVVQHARTERLEIAPRCYRSGRLQHGVERGEAGRPAHEGD